MNADKQADGVANWALKPLNDLDETAIIQWWSKIQTDPFIDYKDKKPFQKSASKDDNFQQANGPLYDILLNQCSTTVVAALLIGAAPPRRASMLA
jgi:hypothetical protein